MVTFSKKILINAPLSDVFDWVQWAPNLTNSWPNILETVKYEQDKNGLGQHEIIYMMLGIQFEVTSHDIEKIHNKKIVSQSDHPIPSELTFKFEEIAPAITEFSFAGEYTVPIAVLRGLTETIVMRLLESDLYIFLDNLKETLEKDI